VDSDYLVDWAFSCQHTLQNVVQEQHANEAHRWPIIRNFDAEGYTWNEKYLVVILRDKLSGVPTMGNTKILDDEAASLDEPISDNVDVWQSYLQKKFSIRPQDFVIIFPIKEGKTIDQRWKQFNKMEQQLWHKQIFINVTRHYYHLKGFDVIGDFFIPPGFLHLTEECQQFLKDHPNYMKNVFIMMKFDENNSQLQEVETELRSLLKEKGFNPLRADDKVYPKDRDLWNNVCTYMICCKQGIAVLENKSKDEYNPNVAIEYGFMRALNKRALLLAEQDFPRARADVVGKLREKFDIDDIKNSIRNPIEKWIKEIENN